MSLSEGFRGFNFSIPAVFEIADGRYIGGDYPCFIIAEIGQNHMGSLEIAKKLIKVAAECSVDCVKFQKSDLESRFTPQVLELPYRSANSFGPTYGEHKKHLELKNEDFFELKQYATTLGLYFIASGMDKESVDFLQRLDVPFFKIGSADTTNLPLINHACWYQKPLLISTGMSSEADVRKMYDIVSKKNQRIALLQCTSCYPTPPCNVNLNVIKTYKELFPDAVIGYSGHELGIEITLAAVANGAKIVERHITLSKEMKGSDHLASLEPEDFKKLVYQVRRIEMAMGSFVKEFQECERSCFEKLGKTVVTAEVIKSGTVLAENHLLVKVAVIKGYDPLEFYSLIGRVTKRDLEKDQTILPSDIQ